MTTLLRSTSHRQKVELQAGHAATSVRLSEVASQESRLACTCTENVNFPFAEPVRAPTMAACSIRSAKLCGGVHAESESGVVEVLMKKRALAAAADTSLKMMRAARTACDLNKLTYSILIHGCIARTSTKTRLYQGLLRNSSTALAFACVRTTHSSACIRLSLATNFSTVTDTPLLSDVRMCLRKMAFRSLGWHSLGPVDGRLINSLLLRPCIPKAC